MDVTWLYLADEACRDADVKRTRHHPKEVFFSSHYDDPGALDDVVLRKVDVIFFSKPPDLTNPKLLEALETVDYFCCQTLQRSKEPHWIEDNHVAKKTGGEFKYLFDRLKKLVTRGDALVAEVDAGVWFKEAAHVEEQDAGLFDDEAASGKTNKASVAEPMDIDENDGADGNGDEEDDVYEVEKVVGDRHYKGQKQYYIKWKGYSDEFNTWEGPENCENCKFLIRKYISSTYLNNPAELEKQMKDFANFFPTREVAERLASAAGGDVLFQDLTNNMVLLKGDSAIYAATAADEWMIANMERPSSKRSKAPPPPPDSDFAGSDIQGIWRDRQPIWLSTVSQFKQHDMVTCREHFLQLQQRQPQALSGTWTRDDTYHRHGKQWFSMMGWAILERAEGSVKALLNLHGPAILTQACSGDSNNLGAKTAVDPLFLATWHARLPIVQILLHAGASPFACSTWSGFDRVLPFEIALVFYYLRFGGLQNRTGVRMSTAAEVLGVMKSTIQPGVPFSANPLYNPRLSSGDMSPQAEIIRLFQDYMRRQQTAPVASVDIEVGRQTARRTGGPSLKKSTPKHRAASSSGRSVQQQAAPSAPMPLSGSHGSGGLDPDLAEGLRSRGLGHYSATLLENGVETLSDLRDASESKLRSMGVKTFHITKLHRLANEQPVGRGPTRKRGLDD